MSAVNSASSVFGKYKTIFKREVISFIISKGRELPKHVSVFVSAIILYALKEIFPSLRFLCHTT